VNVPAAATQHSPIEISAEHPSFAGHFPEFPVLPGAVLLDEALQVIQRQRNVDLTLWQIASAKFLDAVRPGDALRLEHDAPKGGLIRFTILARDRAVPGKDHTVPGKDRTVVRGSLSSPAQAGGAA
jgi:3-hydroxyacyl-[acyl-carrier-protein] dehydratase